MGSNEIIWPNKQYILYESVKLFYNIIVVDAYFIFSLIYILKLAAHPSDSDKSYVP
jgi:hypothetical protein